MIRNNELLINDIIKFGDISNLHFLSQIDIEASEIDRKSDDRIE